MNKIELARLQSLESCKDILVITKADAIEIELAHPCGEVLAPVVRSTLIDNGLAQVHPGHCIGATANRLLMDPLLKWLALPPLLGEDRHTRNNHVQLAVAPFEVKANRSLIDHHGLANIGPVILPNGAGRIAAERIEGELHVLCTNRLAVGEPCLWVESKANRHSIGGEHHLLREEPIHRHGLIETANGQGFEDQLHDSSGREALEGKRIELVKASHGGQAQVAALGRLRIHISKVGEVTAVLGSAD